MSPNLRTPVFGVAVIALLIVASLSLMQRLRAQAPVTLATWTEPALPDTAAGRQFNTYLDVINAGDQEALKQFVREHFSPNGPGGADINARIQSQLRFANTSRGLNLYEVTESSDTAVTVMAQARV